MEITVTVQRSVALVRATNYGEPGMAIELWLGPQELQTLFGSLCKWKNCKALIDGDRVRFLNDGELPIVAPAVERQRELELLCLELRELTAELQGQWRQGVGPDIGQVRHWRDASENILARLQDVAAGPAPAERGIPAEVTDLRGKLTLALVDLVRDGRTLEGHYTEGFDNSMLQAEQLLGRMGVEI